MSLKFGPTFKRNHQGIHKLGKLDFFHSFKYILCAYYLPLGFSADVIISVNLQKRCVKRHDQRNASAPLVHEYILKETIWCKKCLQFEHLIGRVPKGHKVETESQNQSAFKGEAEGGKAGKGMCARVISYVAER